jgi:hypothetical protein
MLLLSLPSSCDAVCVQFILSECPDTWNTTISVMSNVNARHYMNISLRTDGTEQTPSLLTVQTLSQFPHSETPELPSLFLALSTVKIPTPLLRATEADSQFQQDSSTETFHLLFQLAVFALTNRRLNHEVPPPTSNNLPKRYDPDQLFVWVWHLVCVFKEHPVAQQGHSERGTWNYGQGLAEGATKLKKCVAVRWGKTARKWKPGRLRNVWEYNRERGGRELNSSGSGQEQVAAACWAVSNGAWIALNAGKFSAAEEEGTCSMTSVSY